MDTIVDLVLVGELALFIASLMQILKSHPKMPGSVVPYLSGVLGVVACLLWFTVNGELFRDNSINWIDLYRGVAIGIVAAVTSIMGYNLQKALPTPNLLPTSSELAQQRMKESVEKTALSEVTTTAAITTEVIKEETTLIHPDNSIESESTRVVQVTPTPDDDTIG